MLTKLLVGLFTSTTKSANMQTFTELVQTVNTSRQIKMQRNF